MIHRLEEREEIEMDKKFSDDMKKKLYRRVIKFLVSMNVLMASYVIVRFLLLTGRIERNMDEIVSCFCLTGLSISIVSIFAMLVWCKISDSKKLKDQKKIEEKESD